MSPRLPAASTEASVEERRGEQVHAAAVHEDCIVAGWAWQGAGEQARVTLARPTESGCQ